MKKYLFSFVFLFSVFFNCFVSFAGNNTYNLPLPSEVDDNFYYIILKNNDGSFNLHTFSSLPDRIIENDYEGCHHVIIGYGPRYVFHSGDSSWNYEGSYLECILSCSLPSHWDGLYYNRQILYSTFDVTDSQGNLIFSNTPLYITPDEVEDDSSTLSGIGKFFDSLFDKLSSWFGSVIDYIKGIPNAIAYLFTNLGNLLSSLLNSVIEYIKAIPQATVDLFSTLFEYLFVPSDNLFDDVKTLFDERFGFVSQTVEFCRELFNVEFQTDTPHFSITIYGNKYDFIDFSFYDKYKNFIHNMIVCFAYVYFGFWLLGQGPSIIHGFGSTQVIGNSSRG